MGPRDSPVLCGMRKRVPRHTEYFVEQEVTDLDSRSTTDSELDE